MNNECKGREKIDHEQYGHLASRFHRDSSVNRFRGPFERNRDGLFVRNVENENCIRGIGGAALRINNLDRYTDQSCIEAPANGNIKMLQINAMLLGRYVYKSV